MPLRLIIHQFFGEVISPSNFEYIRSESDRGGPQGHPTGTRDNRAGLTLWTNAWAPVLAADARGPGFALSAQIPLLVFISTYKITIVMKRTQSKKESLGLDHGEAVFNHLLLENGEAMDDTAVQRTVYEIAQNLFGATPEQVDPNDKYVKNSLKELLIALILIGDEAHGKDLMGKISTSLDTSVSPGTLYPELHELHEEGVIEQQSWFRQSVRHR